MNGPPRATLLTVRIDVTHALDVWLVMAGLVPAIHVFGHVR
jgi:hypothetical protein